MGDEPGEIKEFSALFLVKSTVSSLGTAFESGLRAVTDSLALNKSKITMTSLQFSNRFQSHLFVLFCKGKFAKEREKDSTIEISERAKSLQYE